MASGSVELTIVKATSGIIETAAVARKLGFVALVAVITAEVVLLTIGATKTPAPEIEPTLADHIAAVLAVPMTWAVNCCCPCELTVAVLGEIEIETPEPPEPPEPPELPEPPET